MCVRYRFHARNKLSVFFAPTLHSSCSFKVKFIQNMCIYAKPFNIHTHVLRSLHLGSSSTESNGITFRKVRIVTLKGTSYILLHRFLTIYKFLPLYTVNESIAQCMSSEESFSLQNPTFNR